MKKLLPFLLLFFCTLLFSQEKILPKGFSEGEQAMLEWYQWTAPPTMDRSIPDPPPNPVRHMAEWEELEALVVTWRSFPDVLREIIRHAKEEVKVVVVVAAAGQWSQSNAENDLTTHGITLDNIEFVIAPSNSVWVRDYGQNTVYANDIGERYFIDWVYNRPRPYDDVMPDVISEHLNSPLYATVEAPYRMVNTGGNFMSDGLGTSFASRLILDENKPGNQYDAGPHDEDAIDDIMQTYMGVDRYIKFEKLPFDGIHHIDMHMHLIDEETILFGQYPEGVSDGPQIEANIQYLQDNHLSSFGTPYRIERIVQPPDFGGIYPNQNGDYRTYSNYVFINKTIIIPYYETQFDTIAQRVYEEHFPGYKVVGINCNSMIWALGALHCITKEVGSSDPLWIVHKRQRDIADNVLWGDYALTADIQHTSDIANAKLYWTTDTTAGYAEENMVLIDASTHTWSASVPHQPDGSKIYYYLQGEANSGKTQVRPLAAPTGYYDFTVTSEPLADNEQIRVELASIYPNPASAITVIPIETNRRVKAVVELMGVTGKINEVLFDGEIFPGHSNVYLDATQYPAGAYFIRVKTEFNSFSRKIIIQ